MSWLDVAGDVVSSLLTADAAKSAASAQSKSTDKANDTTWKMYQQSRQDQLPWLQMGTSALNRLGYLLGLSTGTTGTTTGTTSGTMNTSGFGSWSDFMRQIGAKNSGGQDTVLAHITPSEADLLKANGGSGIKDPVTGGFHFWQENDSDSSDSGDSSDSDSGSGSDSDSSGSDNDGFDPSAGTEGWGSDWNDPENPDYARGSVPGYGESVFSERKGNMGGSILGGGIVGLIAGPKLGIAAGRKIYDNTMAARSGLGNTAGWNSYGDTSSSWSGNGGGWTGNSRDHDGSSPNGSWTGLFGNSSANGTTNGTTTGTPGTTSATSSDADFGSLTKDFNQSNMTDDDGYKYRLEQNELALQRSAAARGNLGGGGYTKDLSNLVQGLASQEYQDAYNRYMNNRSSKFNMLATLAGYGQTSANYLGNYGNSAANTVSNNTTAQGNANAASILAANNAWTGGLNSLTNYWNTYGE